MQGVYIMMSFVFLYFYIRVHGSLVVTIAAIRLPRHKFESRFLLYAQLRTPKIPPQEPKMVSEGVRGLRAGTRGEGWWWGADKTTVKIIR